MFGKASHCSASLTAIFRHRLKIDRGSNISRYITHTHHITAMYLFCYSCSFLACLQITKISFRFIVIGEITVMVFSFVIALMCFVIPWNLLKYCILLTFLFGFIKRLILFFIYSATHDQCM